MISFFCLLFIFLIFLIILSNIYPHIYCCFISTSLFTDKISFIHSDNMRDKKKFYTVSVSLDPLFLACCYVSAPSLGKPLLLNHRLCLSEDKVGFLQTFFFLSVIPDSILRITSRVTTKHHLKPPLPTSMHSVDPIDHP